MNIFITGGTGFIGKHVLNTLKENDVYEIIVLSRQQRGYHNGVLYVQGDLGDKDLIKEAVSQVDYVIHLAGCKKDTAAFYTTNVTGTENIISACNRDRIRKLIYLSSVGVIGPSNDTEITEQTPCKPANDYEKSKYEAELRVKQFSKERPGKTIILRPTNVFGEDDPELHLLNLINKLKRHSFYYVGNKISNYYLNYVYVKEISGLIPKLLDLKPKNDLYIVNTPTPLCEFIASIKDLLGYEEPVRHLPFLPIKMLATCFDMIPRSILKHPPINSLKLSELTNQRIYSNARLTTDLNWKPAFTIQHALSNLIAHYRNEHLLA